MGTLAASIKSDWKGVVANLALGASIPLLATLALHVARDFTTTVQAATGVTTAAVGIAIHPMNAATKLLSGPAPTQHSFATRVVPMFVTLLPGAAILFSLIDEV
ncbi:hypothetical protein RSK20926_13124 [Roseobacter sp. SK209-2-6]|uniref:hypothetical protein n=1 Tax=Roseobacter sp. SK209-2-6 TaxID=388739 RepID=UPI0000F3C7C1|nr:hypothetical protein [Roseobacter sp. SK209-2-6]EBA18666.1 hypothetical protein RSK20926_13124 [Roseobacter sp. SK209-2-6]